MIENVNPSYETLIKRLQQIWQQSQANNDSIQSSQPNNSKINLEPNWLQNIGIIDDTRTDNGGQDIPIVPIVYSTLVPDVISPFTTYIPIVYNITPGIMPMTISYVYQNLLPNVTQEIIPFLEYQTSFSVPKGNMTLSAGFLWNVDAWLDEYVVTVNGNTIWDGFEPPLGSQVEVSQFAIDNNYPTYYQQSWQLHFTSPEGGIYGNGTMVGCILIDIYDETTSEYIPITDAIIDPDTGVFIPPQPTHLYQFETWFNDDELGFTLQYSLMNSSSVILLKNTGQYLCFWTSTMTLENLFYIYEDFISAGDTFLYVASGNTPYPPGITSLSTNSLSPVTFTINPNGPKKYSDVLGQSLGTYVSSPPCYDPFYIRQSKSTDATESWQVNATFGAVVTAPGVQTTGADLPSYNDTYTWGAQSPGPFGWNIDSNHTTIEGAQYYPPQYDMTARVRVAVRPIINWKKTDKYQI